MTDDDKFNSPYIFGYINYQIKSKSVYLLHLKYILTMLLCLRGSFRLLFFVCFWEGILYYHLLFSGLSFYYS